MPGAATGWRTVAMSLIVGGPSMIIQLMLINDLLNTGSVATKLCILYCLRCAAAQLIWVEMFAMIFDSVIDQWFKMFGWDSKIIS